MANNTDFKQEFEVSMKKLQEVNAAIDENIKGKNEFSARILDRIKIIRGQIATLSSKVDTLNKQVPILETNVTENTEIIGSNENKVKELTEDKKMLEEKLKTLNNDSNKKIEEMQKDAVSKQNMINDCEEKIRQIEATNNALKQELDKKGEQTNKEAIEQLSQRYSEEAKHMQDKIDANESELLKKQQEIEQLQQSQQQIEKQINEKADEINSLKDEINKLKTENADLVERIKSATMAIMNATTRLDELNNPDHFNEAELNEKFGELEASIQQISNAIQGHGAGTQPNDGTGAGAGEVRPKVNPNVITDSTIPAKDTDLITVNGFTETYGWFKNQLKQKSSQFKGSDDNNKYLNVLKLITNKTTIAQFKENMITYGIRAKNDKIMGGKKTKKNKKNKKTKKTKKTKKQNGGYIYKTNSKRKSLSKSSRTSKGYSKRG